MPSNSLWWEPERHTPIILPLQVYFFVTSLCVKRKTPKNADQLWYFFASRNHRVYPICREEAVRLLRSTRMARAYSEGAYSSDFDYERYCHALQLHPCIRHLVVSQSCPSSVFNFSVTVQVMAENDILLDIGFCDGVITALELCRRTTTVHNCLCAVSRGSELFVLLTSAVCTLVVQCSAGVHLTVSMFLLCTHVYYTYSCMSISTLCDY